MLIDIPPAASCQHRSQRVLSHREMFVMIVSVDPVECKRAEPSFEGDLFTTFALQHNFNSQSYLHVVGADH
jgi:hypothetical protein